MPILQAADGRAVGPHYSSVNVTTDADGDATEYSSTIITGKLETILYQKTDFADGVDFTITTETTAQNLWVEEDVNASKEVHPEAPVHTYAGVASEYSTGFPVTKPFCIYGERVKIVVAAGGPTKSGTFVIGWSV